MHYSIIKANDEIEKINLPDDIFNIEYNENLVHQTIYTYIHNNHKGIKKQKSRSEVRGGGKKPWKQKGTGRARAGTIRSPLWRSGGKIFAAKGIQKRKKKINKKIYNLSIKVLMSQLIRDKKIKIIEELYIEDNKTKNFLKKIKSITNQKKILIILDKIEKNTHLASRNLKNIMTIDYKKINPFILMKFNEIIINKKSINLIEEKIKC